jgi:hypothetical protein
MTELPRVTEILKSAGLINGDWFTDESRDRGTFIHQATVIDEQGDLDESFEPTRQYMGYIMAWRKFLAEHKCRWTHIEQRMEHPAFRYSGIPDREGTVDDKPTIVDIKSGSAAKWHKLQGAAYCAFFPKPHLYQRLVVRLQDDGTYHLEWFGPHTYQADLGVFLSALTLHNFKRIEGIS